MPVPSHCPNPACANHQRPGRGWKAEFGFYHTRAHGRVQRYRCRLCRRTMSAQTESLHYYAKRRLPLRAVWASLLGGASQREIARRYAVSPMAVQNAVLRLGRQAMAGQLGLLSSLSPRSRVVVDGLRSCTSSQDFPCDITTVIEPAGETILTMAHTIGRRGGRMRAAQRRRLERKLHVWRPRAGTMSRDISRVVSELWDYLRVPERAPAVVDSDEHPLYRAVIARDPASSHFARAALFRHITTPGSAPRTVANRLFAVNYADRLLRHRLREHTRETIAIGRHASLQMHRAWIFAWDHNAHRPWRVRRPRMGVHAAQSAVAAQRVREISASFFTRRRIVRAEAGVPETLRRVWMCELPTPPLRWKRGQRGSSVRVPGYAVRDLAAACGQHAC